MGNSRECAGYKRKAKFGPGAELTGITNGKHTHYVVLDVSRQGLVKTDKDIIAYYYKVYDKLEKRILFIQPYYIERLNQINLLNIGNLRTLLDDADNGFDATPPAPLATPITIAVKKGLTYIPISINLTNPPPTVKK